MKTELVIDIGSNNIRIFKKDGGLVVNEPAIAIIKYDKKNIQLVCAGKAAQKRVARLNPDEQVLYPVSEGVINNAKGATLFFDYFLKAVCPRTLFKPIISVIACVSCGLTNLEKRDIETILTNAGAKDVIILESPIAAFSLTKQSVACIVDIGAKKTEIAVVSEDGIVTGCSVNIAGDNFNQAIIDYVADKYRTIIQYYTTEKLKISLASFYERDTSNASVSGRAILEGEPKTIKIYASEIREAILPVINKIIDVINNVLCLVPEKTANDVFYKSGIFLCGGCSLIAGIAEYIAEVFQMQVRVIENPENAVVNGGATFFYEKDKLADILSLEKIK